MNVKRLREELASMADHLEVRVAMGKVYHADELGEYEINIAQPDEAQAIDRVVFEGQFVGLYA